MLRGTASERDRTVPSILTEPQDQPYGERQYNAQDFYGHRWDFTETITDVAPEEWSGGAFHLE